jgi:hypothetical protein
MDEKGVFKYFEEILLVKDKTFIMPQDRGLRRLWELSNNKFSVRH